MDWEDLTTLFKWKSCAWYFASKTLIFSLSISLYLVCVHKIHVCGYFHHECTWFWTFFSPLECLYYIENGITNIIMMVVFQKTNICSLKCVHLYFFKEGMRQHAGEFYRKHLFMVEKRKLSDDSCVLQFLEVYCVRKDE